MVASPALMKEAPALPPEKLGSWAKDHCDHLLDSIDAQLSWLQVGEIQERSFSIVSCGAVPNACAVSKQAPLKKTFLPPLNHSFLYSIL